MGMEVELQPGNGHVAERTMNQKEPQQQGDQTPSGTDEAELLWKLRKYLMILVNSFCNYHLPGRTCPTRWPLAR